MTENLDIVNKKLNSTDSDLRSGSFTVPASNISGFSTSDVIQPKAYSRTDYGGYYNWYTATAGSGNASLKTSADIASDSICPKGWRLPTGSGSGQFQTLLNGINASAAMSAPYNFKMGSMVNSGSLAGGAGYYWSSTARSSSEAFFLYLTSSSIDPSAQHSAGTRYNGFSVRCLAR